MQGKIVFQKPAAAISFSKPAITFSFSKPNISVKVVNKLIGSISDGN